MDDVAYKQLLEDATSELRDRGTHSAIVIGHERDAERLVTDLTTRGLGNRIRGFHSVAETSNGSRVGRLSELTAETLRNAPPQVVLVAADDDKECFLRVVEPDLCGAPRVVIGGYGHFEFRDPLYLSEVSQLQEASLANGYPNSRVHLYQCLANAARLGLDGVVVEFGMFRGGTTMFMSRVIEHLGQSWPVIGFDTFAGFPARASLFDMYDHKDLSAVTFDGVRDYLRDRNVRVIPGDIRKTAESLDSTSIVVGFIDTDNYTPAAAALKVITERVVPGGALVFDHLTGVDRFRYTLGERMAAEALFSDERFFNLHGTGVFIRQATGGAGKHHTKRT